MVYGHLDINKLAVQSLFSSSSAQGNNPRRQMIHSPEYFRDGKKITQRIAYVMPGLKPALDLCLGNDCEPQQHMPSVK